MALADGPEEPESEQAQSHEKPPEPCAVALAHGLRLVSSGARLVSWWSGGRKSVPWSWKIFNRPIASTGLVSKLAL